MLKIAKMTIGNNILDDAISNLILIDKTKLTKDEIEKLYIYFYFYNNISDLEEIPTEFSNQNLLFHKNHHKLRLSYIYH